VRSDVTPLDVDLDADSGFEVARQMTDAIDVHPGTSSWSRSTRDDLLGLVEASPAIGFPPRSALSTAAIEGLMRGASRSRRRSDRDLGLDRGAGPRGGPNGEPPAQGLDSVLEPEEAGPAGE
jgi:hypothetical protein